MNIAVRYIEAIYAVDTSGRADLAGLRPEGYDTPHVGTRHPRPAERAAHARLPALEGAGRVAGRLLAGLVRFALPVAPPPGEGGRRRERPERRGTGRTPQERLPRDREGREALLRAAAGDTARQLHRGHALPRAPRVLQVPASGDADPPARTAARAPGGSSVHHQGLAARHARAGRRLHARADGARAQRHRIRHRVARWPDRGRTSPQRWQHRWGGTKRREAALRRKERAS